MGKFLGSFDGEEIDRPDLNKCPDCGCFFGGESWPLCKKPCPEEFKAGNRKAVKKKKSRGNSSPRTVTFMEWYHSWWVIIIALLIFPIAGFILLFTSPHKKSLKISIGIAAAAVTVISYVGVGTIINGITSIVDKPVDTSLTKEEYIATCREISAEEFYRNSDSYKDEFVAVTLTVKEKFTDIESDYNGNKYPVYYLCTDGENNNFTLIIRDCLLGAGKNFISGDVITVYGEGDGNVSVLDESYETRSGPCINVAYASRME